MRYGYFMMPLHPLGSTLAETIEADLRQIERLDQLGFEEAWIGEHFTAEWENIPAPDIFIGAALQRTRRIKLGPGVICMPNHSPFQLAHRIAQLDHMARGRFLFGIGTGAFVGDMEAVGIDPASGRQRGLMKDAIELVLKLWDGAEPGHYAAHNWSFNVPTPDESIGKHIHLKPFTKPHPPIALAGVTESSETLRLAGERGWIPLSINLVPRRVLQGHWTAIESGAQSAGRVPDREQWRVARNIHVAPTTEQARDEALNGPLGRDFDQYFLRTARQPGRRGLGMYKQDPAMTDDEVTLEYLLEQVWIVGSPDEVARQLRELHAAVGGFGQVLAMAHDWPDPAVWDRSMTLLAEEVMPRLADLGAVASEPAGAASL
jgi:alkanesulfonate monooxygenase SsuD/methylene tetrahydromethanopterin reductase-like flavin-dependent oxidoreductase (luciferase family)